MGMHCYQSYGDPYTLVYTLLATDLTPGFLLWHIYLHIVYKHTHTRTHPHSGGPKGGNLFECIEGPSGSAYEGGHFLLELRFPLDYPFRPPKVIFKTRMYHCNINSQVELFLLCSYATLALYSLCFRQNWYNLNTPCYITRKELRNASFRLLIGDSRLKLLSIKASS